MHPLHEKIHPSRWCVNRADFWTFELDVRKLWHAGKIPNDDFCENECHNDPTIGPTIYQVNEHYLKPVTETAGGMSWALMKHPAGLKADVFVTHCWAEGIFEFCEKVRNNWPQDAKHLWCCFLSNPQNGNISQLLGNNPMHSPFAKALETCKYFLVVPNCRVSIYSRLWCVFEANIALQRGLSIRLPWQPRLTTASALGTAWFLLVVVGFMAGFFAIPPETSSWIINFVFPWIVVVRTFILMWSHVSEPRANSVMMVSRSLLIGILSGSLVRSEIHEARCETSHSPVCEKNHARLTFIVPFYLGWLYENFYEIVVKKLQREGQLLHFDSVRKARCSNPVDEKAISSAIQGMEDDIDRAIRVLAYVGKWDRNVQANLRRGMSAKRVKRGLRLGATVSYATLLLACPLACFAPIQVVVHLAFVVCAAMWFTCACMHEFLIFVGDVTIWCGLFVFFFHLTIGLARHGQMEDPLSCNPTYAAAKLGTIAAIWIGGCITVLLYQKRWLVGFLTVFQPRLSLDYAITERASTVNLLRPDLALSDSEASSPDSMGGNSDYFESTPRDWCSSAYCFGFQRA